MHTYVNIGAYADAHSVWAQTLEVFPHKSMQKPTAWLDPVELQKKAMVRSCSMSLSQGKGGCEDDDKYDEKDGAAASSSEEKHSKAVRKMEQVSFVNDVHAQATEEQDNYEEDDKNDDCLQANTGSMDMKQKKAS